MKKIYLLLLAMICSVGMMWGETVTFTAADLSTNPKTKEGVTCTMAANVTVSNQQIWKNGGSSVKVDVIQIGNSANQNQDVYYFEISSENEITDVTFTAVNNQSGSNYSIPVVYWTGAAAAAFDGYEMVSLAPKDATVAPAAQSLTIPSGTKTIRFYRTIRTNAAYTEFSGASGYKTLGDGKTAYIISLDVTTADAAPSTSTVYYVNTNDWANVNAYMWENANNTNNNAAWSGAAMTRVQDMNVEGHAVYSYEYAADAAYDKVIFNDGGSNQTADLNLEADKYYYGDAWKTADEIDAIQEAYETHQAELNAISLAGTMNEWNVLANQFVDGQLAIDLDANTDYQFKIYDHEVWYSCYGDATMTKANANNIAWNLGTGNGYNNITLHTEFEGTYTFAWDGIQHQLTITYPLEQTEKVIYSWEGHAGAAIEVGGTATAIDLTQDKVSASVNYANSGYYTLQLGDKTDYTGDHVSIALNNAVKTGDKVTMTAYYTKDSEKAVAVKIADGSKNQILVGNNLPNIYNDANTPATTNYTIPAGVNTSTLLLTRSTTATTAFVTNFTITRTVGLVSREFANTITIDGVAAVAADFNIEGTTITLTNSYVDAPVVALVANETYDDATNGTKEFPVTLNKVGDNFTGNVTINEVTYTVVAPAASAFTVTYFDGANELGSEEVAAGANPEDFANYQTKAHNTFDGWYTEAELTNQVANVAALAINANTSLYGKWTKVYSTSINIEQAVLDNGKKFNIQGAFDAASIEYDKIDALDSLDSKASYNYPFLGLKLKTTGAYVEVLLKAGDVLRVKFGNVAATVNYSVNGAAAQALTITNSIAEYTAAAEETVKIITTTGGTVVLKQIMINEQIAAPTANGFALGTAGYSTFCAPFDYNVTGATAYKAAVEGEVITLTAIEGVIPANEGVVLYKETPEANGVLIEKTTDAPAAVADNALVGTLVPTAFDAVPNTTLYCLKANTNEFHPVDAGVIPAGKAYLPMAASAAPVLRIVTEGQTATALENANAESVVKFIENGQVIIIKNGVRYNALGQMVK